MKKILLIAVFAMFSIFSFSQNTFYGVRAGVNHSTLNFQSEVTSDIDNRSRNGLAIGFFAEYSLSESFSFTPEIQFSAEGAKQESIRIDYIQMPLFFKYKIGESFSVGLGPQVSLKGHDYQDGMKDLGFSSLVGLEYKITEEFFIDLRYSYGFTNVFDDNATLEAKNSNIQLGFGVKF